MNKVIEPPVFYNFSGDARPTVIVLLKTKGFRKSGGDEIDPELFETCIICKDKIIECLTAAIKFDNDPDQYEIFGHVCQECQYGDDLLETLLIYYTNQLETKLKIVSQIEPNSMQRPILIPSFL